MDEPIEVVGAVIVRDGLILCAQRGDHGGLWEFPGGKVEAGETHSEALTREIEEELGCQIHIGEFITSTRHASPTHQGELHVIILHTYCCTIAAGEPVALEHAQVSWVAPDDLLTLHWAPADIPTVERIRRCLPPPSAAMQPESRSRG